MTPAELTAAGYALFGHEWQSPLARALKVNARAVRFWVSGERQIPSGIEAEIATLMGARDPLDLDTAFPRDEWIVGDGIPLPDGARREYVIHMRRPRFVARVADYDADPDADRASGIVYGSADYSLCEIVWIDPAPGPAAITRLLEAACDAVDASAES